LENDDGNIKPFPFSIYIWKMIWKIHWKMADGRVMGTFHWNMKMIWNLKIGKVMGISIVV